METFRRYRVASRNLLRFASIIKAYVRCIIR
jgi:hypothetical protein